MNLFKKLVFLTLLLAPILSFGQGLKSFKLPNGLTVMIWEDHNQSDVFGMVAVRVGSVNDPEQYTGLAHYLEHVMFKGTDKISTLNWQEEQPIYEQIISKYDAMAEEVDPVKKDAINQEINELTIQAAKVSVSNEFSNLMESMGGKNLNAATSFDFTMYHNSFPAYQINKWLEIYSRRLINPVFRAFQPELETVYEEYNRAQDNPSRELSQYILDNAFDGHPYARSVLGLPEHLKNPRLSKLIDFYNEWYVPENMALIIVGNVKAQDIANKIAATFGRLQSKVVPERQNHPIEEIKGRKQYSAKVGVYPMATLIYNGVPTGSTDEKALEIALSLLSNGSQTGVLNKLVLDGELMYGSADTYFFKEHGRCVVQAIPTYDRNQKRFESTKGAEKMLLKAIETIAKGDFEDWKVDAIKGNLCRNYDLSMESNTDIAGMLMTAFINEEELESVIKYKEQIMAITVDDIKAVAKKYLNNNYIALHTEKGKKSKTGDIEKPKFKPLETPEGQQSNYAGLFKNMPILDVEEEFLDFNDVQIRKLNDRSRLLYSKNDENEVFTLVVKYGVGKREFPKLGIAADLMNNAGVMGLFEPQELKQAFSGLNVTSRFSASDDYLYVVMNGYEASLKDACQLLARQILMPKLDEKQLQNTIGGMFGQRQQRKENIEILGSALSQYVRYQDKSPYIDELTDKELNALLISELTGDINRASNYEADIFYAGALSIDTVFNILSQNLPLVANEKPSQSPLDKALAKVEENTVYFLPNSNAEQAQIVFYMPTANYDKSDDVLRDAFYQYFSGGFSGLVLSELREKRSMAYTAGATIVTPMLPGNPTYFAGSIGTQNDKAMEALDMFVELINNMPENSDRIDNIKSYLRQETLTEKPSMRYKAQTYEEYKRKGYTQDPAIENLPKIDALTFDDIVTFYKNNIQGKPMAIGIMGDPKHIDMEVLKKYGKVVKLNERKLFNTKDSFF